jgi:hypothetical protein
MPGIDARVKPENHRRTNDLIARLRPAGGAR